LIKIPPISPQTDNAFQAAWFQEQVRRAIIELQGLLDPSTFNEAVDDQVAQLLVAGTNITLTYDDGAGTLTIDASGGGGGGASPVISWVI
jgi:hypothetical protein